MYLLYSYRKAELNLLMPNFGNGSVLLFPFNSSNTKTVQRHLTKKWPILSNVCGFFLEIS